MRHAITPEEPRPDPVEVEAERFKSPWTEEEVWDKERLEAFFEERNNAPKHSEGESLRHDDTPVGVEPAGKHPSSAGELV